MVYGLWFIGTALWSSEIQSYRMEKKLFFYCIALLEGSPLSVICRKVESGLIRRKEKLFLFQQQQTGVSSSAAWPYCRIVSGDWSSSWLVFSSWPLVCGLLDWEVVDIAYEIDYSICLIFLIGKTIFPMKHDYIWVASANPSWWWLQHCVNGGTFPFFGAIVCKWLNCWVEIVSIIWKTVFKSIISPTAIEVLMANFLIVYLYKWKYFFHFWLLDCIFNSPCFVFCLIFAID